MKYEKNGDVGIIMIQPSKNGNGSDYDPKIALQSIREEIKSDDAIKLIFITGEGNRVALLRAIFEIDERMARIWLRRMKRKGKGRRRVKKDRHNLTHAASLLNL